MKNLIRSKGKIWKRRSKNLKGGEINCPVCGDWKKVPRFIDKHFKEEYTCKRCQGEISPQPKGKITNKKIKPRWAIDCPHKPFFVCKKASECLGCYYNPNKKIALMLKEKDDPKKTARNHWFYGNKKHSKTLLKILDDIKNGHGLLKGGKRTYFKHARKGENE